MSEFIVKNLHNGLGVRSPGLTAIRNSALGRLLHVDPADDLRTVQFKVLIQVERAIDAVAGDDVYWRLVLEHLFNTPLDPAINGLKQGGRLARLAASKPLAADGTPLPGVALGTTSKRSAELGAEISAHWERRPPLPVTEAEVAERGEVEERFRRGASEPLPGPDAMSLEDQLRDWNAGGRRGIERNLRSLYLHFEVYGRCFVTVRHRDEGEFLCVFTRPELLDEYWRTTGRRLGDKAGGRGERVLGVLARAEGVGLLVNPFVEDGSGGYWRADQVASMVVGGGGAA